MNYVEKNIWLSKWISAVGWSLHYCGKELKKSGTVRHLLFFYEMWSDKDNLSILQVLQFFAFVSWLSCVSCFITRICSTALGGCTHMRKWKMILDFFVGYSSNVNDTFLSLKSDDDLIELKFESFFRYFYEFDRVARAALTHRPNEFVCIFSVIVEERKKKSRVIEMENWKIMKIIFIDEENALYQTETREKKCGKENSSFAHSYENSIFRFSTFTSSCCCWCAFLFTLQAKDSENFHNSQGYFIHIR